MSLNAFGAWLEEAENAIEREDPPQDDRTSVDEELRVLQVRRFFMYWTSASLSTLGAVSNCRMFSKIQTTFVLSVTHPPSPNTNTILLIFICIFGSLSILMCNTWPITRRQAGKKRRASNGEPRLLRLERILVHWHPLLP